MAEFGFNEWNKFNEGGGARFFNPKANEQPIVRFMYNTLDDIKMYSVHTFYGQGSVTTISCARPDSSAPLDMCKWCKGGNTALARIIVPVYRVDTGTVEYWTNRSKKFVEGNLLPLFNEVLAAGKPICSQQYKVVRRGEKLQTTYTIIPVEIADNTTVDMLGEIKSPYETGMIKESDYDFDPSTIQQPTQQNTQQYGQQPNYNQGGYNQQYGQAPQQATRRTADTF